MIFYDAIGATVQTLLIRKRDLFVPTKFIFIFLISLPFLQSCTCSRSTESKTKSGDQTAGKTINMYIWGEYTSKRVLDDFEQKTGIHVNETNFSSNEEMLAKLQAGATGYDLIVPSDYMVTIMIKLGLIDKLDRTKIPNAANIDPLFMGKDFDPKNEYSLPYSWSTTGIAFLKNKSPIKITSYKTLISNPLLKNRVSLLDDMREVFGVALKIQGDSVNSTDEVKLRQAAAVLTTAKQHIKEFNSTPAQSLVQGDIVAAQMYSNEALRVQMNNPELSFILPEEGATMSIDNMIVLASSQKKDEVYALINFFLDPVNNQKFVEDMIASPVIKGVIETLPQKFRDNEVISKPSDVIERSEPLRDVGQATTIYDRLWTEIKAR